ncbi:hypothetical protein VNO77_42537 [Canavalia gladiata]|uniref:Uncharacterized protein n=1 Tax=Canavalia gladiata TaxID=3824 RepID=A0AAN9PP46_CANGL
MNVNVVVWCLSQSASLIFDGCRSKVKTNQRRLLLEKDLNILHTNHSFLHFQLSISVSLLLIELCLHQRRSGIWSVYATKEPGSNTMPLTASSSSSASSS